MGASVIFWVVQLLFNTVPFIGSLALLLINGPLWGGLYLLTLDAESGVPLDLKRLLDGFSRFGSLTLSHIFSTIFATLPLAGAFLFAIILIGPSIIEVLNSAEPTIPDSRFLLPLLGVVIVGSLVSILISSWYIFIYVIAVDQGLEFWDVMEESRAIAFDQPFMVIGLVLFVSIINLAGLVALFVGLLFTLPYSVCVISAAYRQMRPLDTERIEGGFTDAQDIPPPPI